MVHDGELYCPVCGRELAFITLWQQPGSRRIRLFCEECSHRPEYRVLPKSERRILNSEGFKKFAAQRQLRNAWEKEHPVGHSADGVGV